MAKKMQFIDLKEALADLKKEVWWSDAEKVHIRRFLKNQKVIEIEPVVHGRWLNVHLLTPWVATGVCSHCNATSYINPDFPHAKHCPNCGAEMDLREEYV